MRTSTSKRSGSFFARSFLLPVFSSIASGSATAADESAASTHPSPRSFIEAALSEKVQRLNQPTTVRDLLANVKVALEEGSFLSGAFYTNDNLRQFFGVPAEIKWLRDTDVLKMVELRGFGYLPVSETARFTIGLIRESMRAENPRDAQQVVAAISMACTCPSRLRLEDVDAVFGSMSKVVTDDEAVQAAPPDPTERFPHSYPALPPPTDPMGNKRVKYVIPTPQSFKGVVESTLVVVLDPSGNIKLIEVHQSEER